jgi:hypothetical protein
MTIKRVKTPEINSGRDSWPGEAMEQTKTPDT